MKKKKKYWTNLKFYTKGNLKTCLEQVKYSISIFFKTNMAWNEADMNRTLCLIREYLREYREYSPFEILFIFFFSSASIKTWNTNFLFRIFIQRNEGNGFSRAVSTCSCAHFSSCENDKRRPCLMTAEAPLPYHKGPSPQRFHFHGFRLQHAKVLFFFATIVPSVNTGNTC